jgi:hypothetical protein
MIRANDNIGCNVTECKYHAKNVMQCSLENIQVVKNVNNPMNQKETDCGSFERG